MPFNEAVAERVRRVLAPVADVTETKMMGALTFMVKGHMACGVTGDNLLVRTGVEGFEAALKEPHVKPMTMGGRTANNFVYVDPAGYKDDADLHAWVHRGLAVAQSLPLKPPAKPRTRKAG